MTYIIAEAGTSHAHPDPYTRYSRAMRHVTLAHEAGADAIKFQIFAEGPLFCPLAGDDKRWERWKQTFLTLDEWRQVKALADKLKIDFLASAFQHETVEWCRLMALRYYKVASRAAITYPYDKVPGPFIVSNGMYRPRTGYVGNDGLGESYVLECTSQYPVPLEQARWSGKCDGLSDHSGTIYPGVDAIVRGAQFLEVHFSDEIGGNDPNLSVSALKTLCDINKGVARLGENTGRRLAGSREAKSAGVAGS
jgi:N,N'-diacetyllegionaminate synthase